MDQLRQRLFVTFTSGTTEELSAILALIYCLSIHNKKMSREAIHSSPAQEPKCKILTYYSTLKKERN